MFNLILFIRVCWTFHVQFYCHVSKNIIFDHMVKVGIIFVPQNSYVLVLFLGQ